MWKKNGWVGRGFFIIFYLFVWLFLIICLFAFLYILVYFSYCSWLHFSINLFLEKILIKKELSKIYRSRSIQEDLIENLKPKLTWVWILFLGARLCQNSSKNIQWVLTNYEQLIIVDLQMNCYTKNQIHGLIVICYFFNIFI